MPLPNRRRVSQRISPWLMFVLSGCSFLDFKTLTSQHGSAAGTGPGGGQDTGGASGESGEAGEGGRAGSGANGGDDSGGAGAGGGGFGGDGGDGGDGANGGEPAMRPDAGGGADAGPPEVPPECANGRRDNEETAVDCGGDGDCPRCADRDSCGIDEDCVSRRCQGGRCEPPSCDDNRANGNETDMDCGGPDDCARCQAGDACKLARDCELPLNSRNLCVDLECDAECLGAFMNCDLERGCETDTADDLLNCGACDIQCSDNHGTPDCNGGVCRPACDAGYDSCGSDADNDGCETDIFTSEAHCGGCDQACSSECVEGDCCPLLTNQSVPNTVSEGCFTIQPTQPNCTLVVQNTDAAVAFTTTSTCNAAGTLQTGQGNRFNATCRTTFHLASTATVHIAWWHDSCN